MSTVIGIVHNNIIWMGSDSCATSHDNIIRSLSANKIFKNGAYIMGYTGSVRCGQVLGPEFFDAPEHIHMLPDLIRDHLNDAGCLVIGDDQTQYMPSNFLIGHQGKLYELLMDFQLNRIMEYTAIGSGAPFALGALYSLYPLYSDNLYKIIDTALFASDRYDTSTSAPFEIVEATWAETSLWIEKH